MLTSSYPSETLQAPWFIISLLLVVGNLIIIFRLTSTLFKNLKKNQLFICVNISLLKKISLSVALFSLVSSLPSFTLVYLGVGMDIYSFEVNYLIIAIMLFAAAKVWVRAIEIAIQNEFTI